MPCLVACPAVGELQRAHRIACEAERHLEPSYGGSDSSLHDISDEQLRLMQADDLLSAGCLLAEMYAPHHEPLFSNAEIQRVSDETTSFVAPTPAAAAGLAQRLSALPPSIRSAVCALVDEEVPKPA